VSIDALALARPGVRELRPFVPGLPVEELERSLGLDHAVRLAANENALGPSPRAIEAMGRAAAGAHRYPDGGGFALKHGLARALGVAPDQVALGNGSNELIQLLVHLFVDPGDEVVFAHPSFVMYGLSTRLLGGLPRPVPGRGHEHDLDAMRAAIGPRTRLVFVCNPNNPTGSLVRRAAWRAFLAAVPERVVVVSDEAYHEYVEDPDYPCSIDDLALERPLVVLRTFSKIHSLAGLRIGYALARPELCALFDRVRLPFNVSSVAQAAALAALDDPGHVARGRALAREGRTFLAAALARLGIAVPEAHANFVLADLGQDGRPLCAALERSGVLVRDLVSFGMEPSFLRITVGTAEENRRFVAALAAALPGRRARVA
jgi:histidinol-phosphate aminotransferase